MIDSTIMSTMRSACSSHEQLVGVHRVADAAALELLLDRRQLLDRPPTGVDAHHAASQPARPGRGGAGGSAGDRAPVRQAAGMTTRPMAFVCAMPMELTPLAPELELAETDVDG